MKLYIKSLKNFPKKQFALNILSTNILLKIQTIYLLKNIIALNISIKKQFAVNFVTKFYFVEAV